MTTACLIGLSLTDKRYPRSTAHGRTATSVIDCQLSATVLRCTVLRIWPPSSSLEPCTNPGECCITALHCTAPHRTVLLHHNPLCGRGPTAIPSSPSASVGPARCSSTQSSSLSSLDPAVGRQSISIILLPLSASWRSMHGILPLPLRAIALSLCRHPYLAFHVYLLVILALTLMQSGFSTALSFNMPHHWLAFLNPRVCRSPRRPS